eukprot:CAMPEP_0174977306 /NCGR_PEP_ID=MMETSP0004_2-20121128/13531_1 /TAXON_ID=420556 /ORGANISM="Ochromonas sp., Strain CCMP1393" /LENGTH=152 /DNA_ID=CAMNT_0016228465 /DNA_START=145 /DNA_END=600 /DNA_ORIENTATION=-
MAVNSSEKMYVSDAADKASLIKTSGFMFAISAPLGTFLDNYHGLFGVLSYENNGIPLTCQLSFDGSLFLKSAIWVPVVFGMAGIVMSLIVILLDFKFDTTDEKRLPSWPTTFYAISFFSFQYYLSGLLDNQLISNPSIHVILAVMAILGYKW